MAVSLMLLVCAPSGQAAAQEAPTLSAVLASAMARNPDILTARLALDSADAERRIARALPNPTITASPNSPYQYLASLPADLGPARWYRTRASGAGRDAARRDVADVIRRVRFAVRQGFYDLLLADERRGVASEQRDIFAQMLAADSVRLASGDIPPRNVTKSLLELTRAEAALAAASARVRQARLALQNLMGVSHPDTGFQVSGRLDFTSLDFARDSLIATARSGRPDLAAARERARQSRALNSLATSALLPAPIITLAWQPDGAFVPATFWTLGRGRQLSLGVGFTLPLFSWYGGERQRARAGVEAADLAVTRTETMVETEVASAWDGFDVARALARRYQSGLLDDAARSLADARYAYGSGALSQLDLLDAIRTYSEVRDDAASALHDYWVSAAALESATGSEELSE